MVKKIITMVLVVTTMVCMIGCGGTETSNNSDWTQTLSGTTQGFESDYRSAAEQLESAITDSYIVASSYGKAWELGKNWSKTGNYKEMDYVKFLDITDWSNSQTVRERLEYVEIDIEQYQSAKARLTSNATNMASVIKDIQSNYKDEYPDEVEALVNMYSEVFVPLNGLAQNISGDFSTYCGNVSSYWNEFSTQDSIVRLYF